MARQLRLKIEEVGVGSAKVMFAGVAHRTRDQTVGWERAMRFMERREEIFFDRVAPRYHLTGATRASLTEPDAIGAIRQAHRSGMVFGTALPQAKYQRTTGPARLDGESDLLRWTPYNQRRMGEIVLDYITEGRER